MILDVNSLKEYVPIHAKDFAFEAMMNKWEEKGESVYASKFDKQWKDVPFTRAELNEDRHGGLPPDNSGLEGKNGGQKGDRGHKRAWPPARTWRRRPS
mmetsp:Transcript_47395/g.109030  ORF Transcript_47395/g.109030 Transcript_47395/m.109030 type:complete len:98 (-) Transcript_47395:63-356(-)